MCFNFLNQRTKILKFYSQPTNGTFAFAPTHEANPSAKAKSLSPIHFGKPFFSQRTRLNTDIYEIN